MPLLFASVVGKGRNEKLLAFCLNTLWMTKSNVDHIPAFVVSWKTVLILKFSDPSPMFYTRLWRVVPLSVVPPCFSVLSTHLQMRSVTCLWTPHTVSLSTRHKTRNICFLALLSDLECAHHQCCHGDGLRREYWGLGMLSTEAMRKMESLWTWHLLHEEVWLRMEFYFLFF